ncbi:peptidase M3, partial [candidate division GN15 bacterium]
MLAIISMPIAAQDNPLLVPYTTPYETPPFDKIQNAHYLPAFQEGIKQQAAEIAAIADNPSAPTFDNTVAAFDRSGELLSNVRAVFYGLLGTVTTPELQDIAKQLSPLLSTHSDNIWLNEKLFARMKAVYDQRATLKLSAEQHYLLELLYRNFQR